MLNHSFGQRKRQVRLDRVFSSSAWLKVSMFSDFLSINSQSKLAFSKHFLDLWNDHFENWAFNIVTFWPWQYLLKSSIIIKNFGCNIWLCSIWYAILSLRKYIQKHIQLQALPICKNITFLYGNNFLIYDTLIVTAYPLLGQLGVALPTIITTSTTSATATEATKPSATSNNSFQAEQQVLAAAVVYVAFDQFLLDFGHFGRFSLLGLGFFGSDMSAGQSVWHFNELPGVACVSSSLILMLPGYSVFSVFSLSPQACAMRYS